MRTSIKILLTFIAIILMFVIHALIMEARGNKVTSGPLGAIVVFGVIVGIIAIWKYNPNKKNNKDNNNQLDKS